MLKVGLVGVGGISDTHIPEWEAMEETELCALCDIRPKQMEKYPDKHHYTDFNRMLENERLDIIDICLPTFLHADFAVKALERGINVICEKPVSLKAEDAARVYGTAEKSNVKFMVAQVLRFWPEYELVKKFYDEGTYGKLLSGSMERLGCYPKWSWGGWYLDEKRSGLVPFDLHIHDLDFLVYTFGAPEKFTSFRAKRPDQDYLNVVYEYDGFFVTAQASWYASPYPFQMKFRFQFENAVVALEDGKFTVYERNGKIFDCAGRSEEKSAVIDLPENDAYANEIRYFTDCVLHNKPADKVKPEQLKTVIDILHQL